MLPRHPYPRPEVGALIPKRIRLEFPRFSGGDPFAWIIRTVQFFRYYEILEEERILNASYHPDDEALFGSKIVKDHWILGKHLLGPFKSSLDLHHMMILWKP